MNTDSVMPTVEMSTRVVCRIPQPMECSDPGFRKGVRKSWRVRSASL